LPPPVDQPVSAATWRRARHVTRHRGPSLPDRV
jgi:hypothetical protein